MLIRSLRPIVLISIVGLSFCLNSTLPSYAASGGGGTAAPEEQQIGQVPPPNTVSYNILRADILNGLSAEAENRVNFYAKLLLIPLSVITIVAAAFGIKTVSDMKRTVVAGVISDIHNNEAVLEKLKVLVSENVSNAISNMVSRMEAVDNRLKLAQLKMWVDGIASKEGFSHAERDTLLDGLNELKSDRATRRLPDFAAVLEKVIDQFYAAALYDRLPAIEDEFQEEIAKTPGIVHTLTNAYALQVFGQADRNSETLSRFRKYAGMCKQINYYDVSLPFLMVLTYRDKPLQWEAQLEAYIEDVAYFEEADRKRFIERLDRYSHTLTFQKRTTAEGERISRAFKQFQEAYRAKLDKVFLDHPAPES